MKNNSKLKSPLICSIYEPEGKRTKNLFIYVHCFNGNWLEGIQFIDNLEEEFSLLVYDLRGSGNNMSKYVTLGLRESEDLNRVMDHIVN